jgi:DNA-binding response OmpR family regulator
MTKILIVDDDVNTTWLMDNVFSKAGYEIHSVNNSSLAVPEAIAVQPDLIILDLMMPGTDGIGTCQALKANQETNEIPVLVFSAVGDVNSKVRAFDAGAKDFIPKPIHIEELKSRIRVWTNHNDG